MVASSRRSIHPETRTATLYPRLLVPRCKVMKRYTAVVPEDQKGFLSDDWHDRLSKLIAKGKKVAALAFLEKTIEHTGGGPVRDNDFLKLYALKGPSLLALRSS